MPPRSPRRTTLIVLACTLLPSAARADITPAEAAAFFDFGKGAADLAVGGRALRLHRLAGKPGPALELADALHWAETDAEATAALARKLDGVAALSVGGWFFSRRTGGQTFFCRGLPETAPLGELTFRPRADRVTFCLGTDPRGFFLGTVHGNGSMPFPY